MPVEEALAAVRESGAPIVSIAGGEPTIHPRIDVIINKLIEEKYFVYCCTNGLLLDRVMDKVAPSKYLCWVVHLDGVELKIDPVLQNGEILTCSVKNRLNFASGLAMGFEMIEDNAALDYAKKLLEHLPMDYCIDISTRGGVLMEINPRVSTYIYGENYCAPYLSLKLAMGEMSADEIRNYQKELPIGKKMFRYYGQIDY